MRQPSWSDNSALEPLDDIFLNPSALDAVENATTVASSGTQDVIWPLAIYQTPSTGPHDGQYSKTTPGTHMTATSTIAPHLHPETTSTSKQSTTEEGSSSSRCYLLGYYEVPFSVIEKDGFREETSHLYTFELVSPVLNPHFGFGAQYGVERVSSLEYHPSSLYGPPPPLWTLSLLATLLCVLLRIYLWVVFRLYRRYLVSRGYKFAFRVCRRIVLGGRGYAYDSWRTEKGIDFEMELTELKIAHREHKLMVESKRAAIVESKRTAIVGSKSGASTEAGGVAVARRRLSI